MIANQSTWRELVNKNRPFVLPGAYDALSAKLIEQQGFEGLVVGGFPLVGSRFGLPDIGLVGLGEMAEGMRDIINATQIPVLVDGDNGYGDEKNVARTIQTYEKMGASAILLEDQVSPKRCGHAAGKDVISMGAMARKIQAAVSARNNKDFFIIARTDARGVNGLDDALRRCEENLKAGADGIFVEAPQNIEELEQIAKSFDVPQMCNMLIGGQTPILSNQQLHEMGFSMIVHGTTLIKRVAKSLQIILADLYHDRLDCNPNEFVPLLEFMSLTGAETWQQFEESIKQDNDG
jgi:2-methylisocitrate lyase-like PEP mutase family enzyme